MRPLPRRTSRRWTRRSPSSRRAAFSAVEDGYSDLVPDDFFDADWVLGDDGPADGVHALVAVTDVATVVVPDLYQPSPLPELDGILDAAVPRRPAVRALRRPGERAVAGGSGA